VNLMKNYLIPGLVALLVFVVSAALLHWLDQPKEHGAEEKQSAKEHARERDVDQHPAVRPGSSVGSEDPSNLAVQMREQLAVAKEREARLDRRHVQIELLLQDIRTEREAIENLRKQFAVQMKMVTERMADVDGRIVQVGHQRDVANKKVDDSPKQPIFIPPPEDKNPVKMTPEDKNPVKMTPEDKNPVKMTDTYSSMPPEDVAKFLQQLVGSGKMETAVNILSQMKETKAAKVLAEMSDLALAAQLLEKMLDAKRSVPVPTFPLPTLPGG
jgi:flagellar motility protein MotE (MotC chaperone)